MSKRKNWPVIISDCEQSGLSVSEYCRRKKIGKANFFKWRKRLKSPEAPKEHFIAVKFSPEKPSLSLNIGDSIHLELKENIDSAQLLRIIEALRSVC